MTASNARESLEDFFTQYYRDETGFVYLPVVDKEKHWRSIFFEWPKHTKDIVNHCLRHSSEGSEVYFSPAIYTKPSPRKEYIKGVFSLWVDFDGNAPDSWETSTDTPGEDSEPTPSIVKPSLRVQTSQPGNQHAYWMLDTLVTDVGEIEKMNRVLAYQQNADTSGWDATQLLRPPHTINYGYAKPERKGKTYDVVIDEQSSRIYERARFLYNGNRFARYCASLACRQKDSFYYLGISVDEMAREYARNLLCNEGTD